VKRANHLTAQFQSSNHHQHTNRIFLWARRPSCHPTVSNHRKQKTKTAEENKQLKSSNVIHISLPSAVLTVVPDVQRPRLSTLGGTYPHQLPVPSASLRAVQTPPSTSVTNSLCHLLPAWNQFIAAARITFGNGNTEKSIMNKEERFHSKRQNPPVVLMSLLHCVLASGTVYCNRSCLCVCVFVAGGRCPNLNTASGHAVCASL